jgi:hypothetical protein
MVPFSHFDVLPESSYLAKARLLFPLQVHPKWANASLNFNQQMVLAPLVEVDSETSLPSCREPQVKCLSCGAESNKRDVFMDLSLDISAATHSVSFALQAFIAPETLDGSNKYRCEKCKQLSRARKQMQILKAPNVLVIQLKVGRFTSRAHHSVVPAFRFSRFQGSLWEPWKESCCKSRSSSFRFGRGFGRCLTCH